MTIQQALTDADAVLFDFDGVILNSEWPIYQTWLELFQREGQDLPPDVYVQCIGSDFDTWSPEKHLEDLTGKKFDWPHENAQRQIKIESQLKGAPPMPGIVDLLEKLSAQKTAVVSSSSHRWVDGWVETLNLMPHFETLVCRGDAPRIKPAPDLYLEAAKQLEVSPANCLVIEDSYNGMLAAHEAGMKVLAVPTQLTAMMDFSPAEWQCDSLEEAL